MRVLLGALFDISSCFVEIQKYGFFGKFLNVSIRVAYGINDANVEHIGSDSVIS